MDRYRKDVYGETTSFEDFLIEIHGFSRDQIFSLSNDQLTNFKKSEEYREWAAVSIE